LLQPGRLIQLFGELNQVQAEAAEQVGGTLESDDIVQGVRLIGIEGIPESEPGIRLRVASGEEQRCGQENGSTDLCQCGPLWKMSLFHRSVFPAFGKAL
jgi:hypothetical protein